jgi:hypothetical protein
MPFHQVDSVSYYTFASLDKAGVRHAIFTRQGGISPAPWHSLNVGGLRGDDPARVLQNRVLAFQALGRDPLSVYDVWQVHSTDVICTDIPRPPSVPHIKADGIVTDRPEISLFMRFGDCVPVLLFDPVHGVVALAHAGWLGSVRGTVSATIQAMQAKYNSRPPSILAAIGPSIAAHHYPVGPEVINQVRQAFGREAEKMLIELDGEVCFDLWEANTWQLQRCGVTQIEVAGLCTACDLENWYSHRAENGQTGRFGALITIG